MPDPRIAPSPICRTVGDLSPPQFLTARPASPSGPPPVFPSTRSCPPPLPVALEDVVSNLGIAS
eukprot:7372986-Lingulodinium_polyedra.AAC.1